MNILPKDTILGKLAFYEIYDEFDGPRCFSAINSLRQVFLVYWCGDFENNISKWIYAPISQKRLDDLRRVKFSIRDVYDKPEQCLFHVSVNFNNQESNVDIVSTRNSKHLNLPPASFYLEPDDIEVIDPEADWDFELKIANSNNKAKASPERTVVTQIMDALSEILESLIKTDKSKKQPQFYPLNAVYGSFEVKIGSNDHEKTSIALSQLNEILADESKMNTLLKKYKLDPYRVKDLLDITNQHRLSLKLTPKTNRHFDSYIEINDQTLPETIKTLENCTKTFLDSDKIPQSNSLDRVVEFVDRRSKGEILSPDNIKGIGTKRHIAYYLHGARCLGLLSDNHSITTAGRCLLSKETPKARYQFLADRFESSDFGWAWLKWSKVNSISALDPNTADEFVRQCVRGFSSTTTKRRATTLRAWLSLLQEYRRDYD